MVKIAKNEALAWLRNGLDFIDYEHLNSSKAKRLLYSKSEAQALFQ